MKRATPATLAARICAKTQAHGQIALPRQHVTALIEILYAASLSTDEGEIPLCEIVWLDPDAELNPFATTLQNCDRWEFFRFAEPVRCSVRELTKLARSSDPRTSSLVIYPGANGSLYLWGIVDQASTFVGLRSQGARQGYAPPGDFQVSITGLARLEAFAGLDRIATLHIDQLHERQFDVFRDGPVHRMIRAAASRHSLTLAGMTGFEPSRVTYALVDEWIGTLSRVLSRIRSFRHGAALLFGTNEKWLRTKYSLNCERWRDAVVRHVATRVIDERYEFLYAENQPPTPLTAGDLREYRRAVAAERAAESEIAGAEWFVALLSRVDGAVSLTSDFVITGYGAEITAATPPSQVYLATDVEGALVDTALLEYDSFGTRHRSAMRLCDAVPSAVAFVVSQDGDVRAIANVDGRVTVWEDIKLDFADYLSK